MVPDSAIEFTRADIATVHAAMVDAAGDRNVWIVGGGDLAGQFADAGLLDEVIVSIARSRSAEARPSCPAASNCAWMSSARTASSPAPGTRSCAHPVSRPPARTRPDKGAEMTKLKFDITMSLDGFIAGPNPGPDAPLGEGGERLHQWVFGLKSFEERHGRGGGETNRDDEIAEESLADTGAVIMGRGMFGGGPGPWDESWEGWWGG